MVGKCEGNDRKGIIHMEKLVNFRDIGGYKTSDHKTVKIGKLFRGNEPVQLPEQDKEALQDNYHIQLIVDFRKKQEVEESPDDTIEGARYCNIDILKDVHDTGAGLKDFFKTQDTPAHMMKALYQDLVLSKSAQEGYRIFIKLLLKRKNTPVLFHCFAGKDRTGMAAAIILGILGVSRDDIMIDYLKSNPQRKATNDQMIEQMRQNNEKEEEIARVEKLLYVKKEYLEEAYHTIDQTYGSFHQYIIEGLSLPKSIFDELKNLYTE